MGNLTMHFKKRYAVWILVAILFASMDTFSESHPWNEDHLEGYMDEISCSSFLLAMPVSLPDIYLLSFLGEVLNYPLIGFDSRLSDLGQLWVIALGDFVVCFLYFLVFEALLLIWRLSRSKYWAAVG